MKRWSPEDRCFLFRYYRIPFHDEFAASIANLHGHISGERKAALSYVAWAGMRSPEFDEPIFTPSVIPTVLAALWCVLRDPDSWSDAVAEAIRLGGDVDTLGAIVGTLMGAKLGTSAIPGHLARTVVDAERLRRLAGRNFAAIASVPSSGRAPGLQLAGVSSGSYFHPLNGYRRYPSSGRSTISRWRLGGRAEVCYTDAQVKADSERGGFARPPDHRGEESLQMRGNRDCDRRAFLSLLAGAAAAAPAHQTLAALAAWPARPRWAAVRSLIDKYVAEGKVAGAVAALSAGSDPPSYPAAGLIALDSPTRFDENSICRIYSMTKAVTGVAAMALVEDRRIALDQPVAEVLPEWRSLRVAVDVQKGLDSRPARGTMTMRHLLTHTSGLSYWTPTTGEGLLPKAYREHGITPGNYGAGLNRPGYGPQAKGLVDMIERVAKLPLAFEPGTEWQYSIGLDVMGLVIERVSGKPFEVFLRERLFSPLDMTSTGFRVEQRDAARLTTNYTVTPEGLRPSDPAATSVWRLPPPLPAGGAGLVSTARDFWRFGAMLLGDGALGRARVVKHETARLALSNLLPAGVVFPRGGGFGAGMRVVITKDGRNGPVGSAGWSGAAGTIWRVDPAQRVNSVFLTQFMPPTSYPIWDEFPAALEEDLRTGTA